MSQPDYQQIVQDCANELGARIVDVRSEESLRYGGLDLLGRILGGFSPVDASFSVGSERLLFIPTPVETEIGCLVALHELGHIATTPQDMTRGEYDEVAPCWEAKATQWALDHTPFTPSAATAAYMEDALDSYEESGGLKGAPFARVEKELRHLQA